MGRVFEGELTTAGLRFAIVIGRFNSFLGERLLEGAQAALRRHGAVDEAVDIAWVPGAFEIPTVAMRLAESGRYDAVICLGVVIRGATPHFEYVAGGAAKGSAQVGIQTGVPAVFGVVTTDTIEQAIDRSGAKAGNKGWDAAMAAIEMANLMKILPGRDAGENGEE